MSLMALPGTDHSTMKLGKLPPKYDRRTLRMADYLDHAILPPPPPQVDWSKKLTALGMMANDRIGDCTCAATGHLHQLWTANNGPEVTPPDSAIIKAYEDVGHYVPGDESTDNGCVELDVLNYWRKVGIGGHKIFAYVGLEPRNRLHVELAISLFGGATIGVALPVSAQRQHVWSVVGGPDAVPGSWGGHEIALVAYNPMGLTCITWGKLLVMTWEFFVKYTDEAYGVLSADWAAESKKAPSGFTFAQLEQDLKVVIG
jgi:hypothetical protein